MAGGGRGAIFFSILEWGGAFFFTTSFLRIWFGFFFCESYITCIVTVEGQVVGHVFCFRNTEGGGLGDDFWGC